MTAGPAAARGLTLEAAREGLATHGPNELRREVAKSRWVLFGAQFVNPLVGLLLAACVVSALLGELPNAMAIGVIVVVNAVIGFSQEARAERAILALRSMTAPRARLRDGIGRDPGGRVVPATCCSSKQATSCRPTRASSRPTSRRTKPP